MTYTIKIVNNTTLKTSTNQAVDLPPEEKAEVNAGTELPIVAYTPTGKHIKFTLAKDSAGKQRVINGRNTWLVYAIHCEVLKNGSLVQLGTSIIQSGSFMLMKASGKRDQFGGDLYRLSWMQGGREVDAVLCVSGQPGKKPVRKAEDASGSMAPCPEGSYRLGAVEYGWFGNGIGSIWISVFGTEPRQAIGVHCDANRQEGFPGSAGCICPLNDADMQKVAGWRNSGAETVIVDHGFGTVRY